MVVTLTPLPRGPATEMAQRPPWSGAASRHVRGCSGAWSTASPNPRARLPERESLSLRDPADSPWRGDKGLNTS